MDFSSVNEAALASLENPTPVTPEPVSTPAPEAPKVEPTAIPGSESANPQAPVTPAPEGQRYKVKVRGEELEVTHDELLQGYSRTADYTRSKQELSEYKKTADRQIQDAVTKAEKVNKEAEQMKAFLNDPNQVLEYAEKVRNYLIKTGQLPPQGAPEPVVQGQAPTQVGTVSAEQARLIARQEAARVEAEFSKHRSITQEEILRSQEAARQQFQLEQETQQHAKEFDNVFNQVFTKYPALKLVNRMEDIIRFQVLQSDPATAEEAKDLIVKVAEAQAAEIDKYYENLHKQKIANQANLQKTNIEPSGGTGPAPTPTQHRFGSPELSQAAIKYIESSQRGS